jgi:hypothetical protein
VPVPADKQWRDVSVPLAARFDAGVDERASSRMAESRIDMKKTVFTVAVVVSLVLGPRGVARAQSEELTEGSGALWPSSRPAELLELRAFGRAVVADGRPGAGLGESGAAALVVRSVGDIYRMTGDDAFAVRKTETDEIGQVHARLQQQYRGLRVVGGD